MGPIGLRFQPVIFHNYRNEMYVWCIGVCVGIEIGACQRPRLILSTRQQSRRQCSASDQQNVIPVVNRTNSPSKRRLRSLTSVAALTCCRIASCHGTPTISLTVRRYVSLAGHKLNLPRNIFVGEYYRRSVIVSRRHFPNLVRQMPGCVTDQYS